MSEFSKEYLGAINSSWDADFSYLNELIFVEDGTPVNRICEGFGSLDAILISNDPYLLFSGSDPAKIFDAIENIRNNQKTKGLSPFL